MPPSHQRQSAPARTGPIRSNPDQLAALREWLAAHGLDEADPRLAEHVGRAPFNDRELVGSKKAIRWDGAAEPPLRIAIEEALQSRQSRRQPRTPGDAPWTLSPPRDVDSQDRARWPATVSAETSQRSLPEPPTAPCSRPRRSRRRSSSTELPSTGADGPAGPADVCLGWSFPTLNRALRLLMCDDAVPLVALGMTRYWRVEDGLRLDAGAFVRALEYAAGRTAVVVVGKPNPTFYGTAVDALQVPADQVVMIGDDIHTDIKGAQQAGLPGVLVRTGEFSASDLSGGVGPDAVLDSVADLPRWWAGL